MECEWLRRSSNAFWCELKRDFFFFCICGVVAAIPITWGNNTANFDGWRFAWLKELSSGFMSFGVFGFLSVLYLCLVCISKNSHKLSDKYIIFVKQHVELRLIQFSSTMLSFVVGVIFAFLVRKELMLIWELVLSELMCIALLIFVLYLDDILEKSNYLYSMAILVLLVAIVVMVVINF